MRKNALRRGWRLLLIACLLTACARSAAPQEAAPLSYSEQIYVPQPQAFLSYSGPGAFDSYLSLDLPYAPVQALLPQLERVSGQSLQSRGEAHITVITPVEYWQSLRPYLSLDEIAALAQSFALPERRFELRCLGSGRKFENGSEQESFFLVVSAPALLEFRKAVQQRLIAKGGQAEAFDPAHYMPHITVGFKARDLHESDGVIKDMGSCDPRFRLQRQP